MIMVGRGELVLNDEHAVIGEVASEEVERERPDGMLGGRELEINTEYICKHV